MSAVFAPVSAQTFNNVTEYIRGSDRVIASITQLQQPFTDVSTTAPYYGSTSVMLAKQITIGCSTNPPQFCPDPTTSPSGYLFRYSMAVFVIRAWSLRMWGDPEAFKTFSPPSNTPYFADAKPTQSGDPNAITDQWSNYVSSTVAANFPYIQKMWELGFTVGCVAGNDNTTRKFCPGDLPNNQYGNWNQYWHLEAYSAAVFSVRARLAAENGCVNGSSCGSYTFTYNTTPYFSDVPSTDSNFKYIQYAAQLGGVSTTSGSLGCTPQPQPPTKPKFCPYLTTPAGPYIYRGQMAMYVVRVILGEKEF